MERKPFYITTPIYYPSDRLHIGHAYTTTIADALARYHRLAGEDVLFLTGSDEHGQKIQRRAAEQEIKPKEYVDRIVATFQDLWRRLNVSYDDFVRTTEPRHHKVVQEIFRKIYENGDIYKDEYEGWYCMPCETFWLERQLVDGKCPNPDCRRPVELLREESYFFRLSKYQDRLLEHIKTHPEFIQPASRRNEMIKFIEQGLEDLCISRTTFDWGIPVPINAKHVIYVWFDALSNYLTGAGWLQDEAKFAKFWPADLHLVGKEIVRFHTIIWPIMLMAAGLPLPKTVFGHGWLVLEGEKMSKSKGNVVDPVALIEEFGADAIRYFLLREISFGADGNFSRAALIQRINSDLANDLGNLLYRTSAMLEKFTGGRVPEPAFPSDLDQELIRLAEQTVAVVDADIRGLEINAALAAIWRLIGRANKYIDETAPWNLAKNEETRAQLHTVLYNLAEVLRIVALEIFAFVPATSTRIWQQLGLEGTPDKHSLAECRWGLYPAGRVVHREPPLFPRIEIGDAAPAAGEAASGAGPAAVKGAAGAAGSTQVTEGLIGIEDFARLDLRVGTVLSAEKVEGADKLLKLMVDLGEETRQVVAGVAQYYRPEELAGRQVVLVANLKPAKLKGITSQGMILAASTADRAQLAIVAPESRIASGSKVK
ncbi:MAG: methionine--tRNA ligase [Firmicutes bacterium]|nr:methionine--tRNA ligase [Bacillota bacterium]